MEKVFPHSTVPLLKNMLKNEKEILSFSKSGGFLKLIVST